jgi:hypothetical protein
MPDTQVVADSPVPSPPTEPPASDFPNPYESVHEQAEVYRAGYFEGAFGDHSTEAPAYQDQSLVEIWREGNAAGLARFGAYKQGFKTGVEDGLTSQATATPHYQRPDLTNAWQEGFEAGTRRVDAIRAAIRTKAVNTEHFDVPTGPIQQIPPDRDGPWRYVQEFDGGQRAIYVAVPGDVPDDAYALDAPIHAAYRAGARDYLGWPRGDTARVGDGRGSYANFARGQIYATPETGAHALRGKIGAHWHNLGGPSSYLKYPTSSRCDNEADGGWAQTFEGGDIYHWAEQPIVDVGQIEIHYRGMNCFGDTDEAWSDEPYPIITVLGPLTYGMDGSPRADRTVTLTGPEESALGGGSYPRDMLVYRGRVADVGAIQVTLMEHDEGDPNAYRAQIEAAVRTTLTVAASAIAGTGVGLPVSGLVMWLAQAGAGPVSAAINNALDTDDDRIGGVLFPLSPGFLLDMARSPRKRVQDVEFHLGDDVLISGDGASYKSYFDVRFV